MRIVFAGTPAFGLPLIEAIARAHTVVSIYTQPDRGQGRGQKQQYSPIKAFGLAHHIPVFQPEHFKSQATITQLKQQHADVMVVVAYGLILPKTVLTIPRYGCINVHASLLPRWRGAAPIQYALLQGDVKTGVTIMQMDVGMDTGDILASEALPIAVDETAGSLHDKLSQLSVKPLLSVLERLGTDQLRRLPQAAQEATYASKINKQDAKIDWTQKAIAIERMVRAYMPWPIAFTEIKGECIRIFEASVEAVNNDATPGTILAVEPQGILVATCDAGLRIKRLQCSGGKVLAVSEWIHGHAAMLQIGQRLI